MPISIPPFENVPAPEDPITSAWAQDLTQFAVDQISVGPTEPTNPDAELWYDTDDTGISLPNTARGIVAKSPMGLGTVVAPAGGAKVPLAPALAFTPVIGRYYRCVVYMRATQGNGGVTHPGHIEVTNWPGGGAIDSFFNGEPYFSNARIELVWLATNATPVSLTAKGSTGHATQTLNFYTDGASCFYVEDIGGV